MSGIPEKEVVIFTDGACSGNPGAGGCGTVLNYKGVRKELSEGFRWTTNNRMELMALIKGLLALKEPCKLDIYTDSKYLLGGFEKGWLEVWKKNGWKTSGKLPVQNRDLWEQLDELLNPHCVHFIWVKGHANDIENNRCDELAVNATKKHATSIDKTYERGNPYKKNIRVAPPPCSHPG